MQSLRGLDYNNSSVMHFLSPIINGKVEDRNVGEGPSLTMMFEDDKHLQYLSDKLKVRCARCFFRSLVFATEEDFIVNNTYITFRKLSPPHLIQPQSLAILWNRTDSFTKRTRVWI